MGWQGDQVVRNNTRNTGATIWDEDAVATQPIDSVGHDFHDQDLADSITACLNINGANQMLTNLNVGNFKLLAVADGTNPSDGVNFGQLTGVTTDVTALQQGIITSITWTDNVLTHVRSGGNFDVTLDTFTTIKSDGTIRHVSALYTGVTVLADIDTQTRFTYINDGNATLTFQRPTGVDPDLGENYCVEGSVLITNTGTPGTLTLNNDGGAISGNNILGTQNTNPNEVMVLSYLIHRQAGNVYQEVYSWCT